VQVNIYKNLTPCSKEARKRILEERPGVGGNMLNTLVSMKWKVLF